MKYSEPIKRAVQLLCRELCLHYPDVFKHKYDSCGYLSEGKGETFQQRMEMGVFIELIKAGIKFEELSNE